MELPMENPGVLFWNLPLDSLQLQLKATTAGLSQTEAAARRVKFGPNTLRDHGERTLLIQYLSHFKNPLVMVLLAASAVSALTGEITGFVIIWAIVLMSVTLDFYPGIPRWPRRGSIEKDQWRYGPRHCATVIRRTS